MDFFNPPQKHPIDSFHRELVFEVALHEAGHYIVGRALGLSMGALSLCLTDFKGAHQGMAEITPVEKLPDTESLVDWLGRRIQQLYAGVVAQSMDSNGCPDEDRATAYARKGGVDDYSKTQMLIHIIRNVTLPAPSSDAELGDQLRGIHDPLWESTFELVIKEAKFIRGVADRLTSMVKMTNVTYTLSVDDLNKMTALEERFGKQRTLQKQMHETGQRGPA